MSDFEREGIVLNNLTNAVNKAEEKGKCDVDCCDDVDDDRTEKDKKKKKRKSKDRDREKNHRDLSKVRKQSHRPEAAEFGDRAVVEKNSVKVSVAESVDCIGNKEARKDKERDKRKENDKDHEKLKEKPIDSQRRGRNDDDDDDKFRGEADRCLGSERKSCRARDDRSDRRELGSRDDSRERFSTFSRFWLHNISSLIPTHVRVCFYFSADAARHHRGIDIEAPTSVGVETDAAAALAIQKEIGAMVRIEKGNRVEIAAERGRSVGLKSGVRIVIRIEAMAARSLPHYNPLHHILKILTNLSLSP